MARDHLFVAAGEVAFGEMDGVGKLEHLAQEIGTRAKTFDDSRNLLAAGTSAPVVVGSGHIAGGLGVFDDPDLGRWFGGNDVLAFGFGVHFGELRSLSNFGRVQCRSDVRWHFPSKNPINGYSDEYHYCTQGRLARIVSCQQNQQERDQQ